MAGLFIAIRRPGTTKCFFKKNVKILQKLRQTADYVCELDDHLREIK
jgi:hypothetical protein